MVISIQEISYRNKTSHPCPDLVCIVWPGFQTSFLFALVGHLVGGYVIPSCSLRCSRSQTILILLSSSTVSLWCQPISPCPRTVSPTSRLQRSSNSLIKLWLKSNYSPKIPYMSRGARNCRVNFTTQPYSPSPRHLNVLF